MAASVAVAKIDSIPESIKSAIGMNVQMSP